MIAAAVAPRDALNINRQIFIASGYDVAELVDLSGCVRRCLDLDPAANAIENF
jgi:hypothetical protein